MLALGNVACPCVTALRLLTPAGAGLQTLVAAPLVGEPPAPTMAQEEEPALGQLCHVGMGQRWQPRCRRTGMSDPCTNICPRGERDSTDAVLAEPAGQPPWRPGGNLPPRRRAAPWPRSRSEPLSRQPAGAEALPRGPCGPAGTRLWLPSHV